MLFSPSLQDFSLWRKAILNSQAASVIDVSSYRSKKFKIRQNFSQDVSGFVAPLRFLVR